MTFKSFRFRNAHLSLAEGTLMNQVQDEAKRRRLIWAYFQSQCSAHCSSTRSNTNHLKVMLWTKKFPRQQTHQNDPPNATFLWLDDALIPLQNFLNIWTLHPDFEDTFFSLHMMFLFFHATHMHNIGCNIKKTRDPVN